MIVRRPSAEAPPPERPVTYRQRPLRWVDEYKYLGVTFHRITGLKGGAREAGAQTGLGRLTSYMSRHPELRQSLELRQRLFNTLALPGSEYGCITWAFEWLAPCNRHPVQGGYRPARAPAELVQLDFCRQLLRAPSWVAQEIGRASCRERVSLNV